MLDFLKIKKKKKLLHNDLINRIENILYYKENINEIIFNNINKYILLNLNSKDILELNNSINNTNSINNISVSIEKFFKTYNGYVDLYVFLNRAKSLLEENKKLNEYFLNDLNEILNVFEFILEKETS